MSNKVFGIVLSVLVVALLGGAILLGGNSENSSTSTLDAAEVLKINESDHVRGNPAGTVTVIEYGDFQCPFCGDVHPILDQVVSEYEDRVQFSFRHFPIVNAHPRAMIAHRSAEAAGKQDKFFEMHDLLFERQSLWSEAENAADVIRGYAEEIGLDMVQFDNDYKDPATLSFITDQLKEAEAIGVNSTPSFYINGEKLEQPPRSAADLIEAIEKALANSESSEASSSSEN